MLESESGPVNITRYDGAHGVPHRDQIGRNGRLLSKTWMHGVDFEAALEYAVADLKTNYPHTMKRGSKRKALPLVPGASRTAGMTDKEFIAWMASQGAQPIGAKRREQLRRAGQWIDAVVVAPAA